MLLFAVSPESLQVTEIGNFAEEDIFSFIFDFSIFIISIKIVREHLNFVSFDHNNQFAFDRS